MCPKTYVIATFFSNAFQNKMTSQCILGKIELSYFPNIRHSCFVVGESKEPLFAAITEVALIVGIKVMCPMLYIRGLIHGIGRGVPNRNESI